jgi:subtilisin family serine protease
MQLRCLPLIAILCVALGAASAEAMAPTALPRFGDSLAGPMSGELVQVAQRHKARMAPRIAKHAPRLKRAPRTTITVRKGPVHHAPKLASPKPAPKTYSKPFCGAPHGPPCVSAAATPPIHLLPGPTAKCQPGKPCSGSAGPGLVLPPPAILTSLPRRAERDPLPLPDQASLALSDHVLVLVGRNQPASLEEELARVHRLGRVANQIVTVLDSRVQLYRIRDGRSVQSIVAALSADLRVTLAQANFRYRHQGDGFGSAPVLQYAHAKIDLPRAHQIAQGRNVLVAVIDSGIELSHPDLDGVVAKSFDAVGDRNPAPHAHGTAVAGIISARGTIEGVAPQARLLAVRAFQMNRANGTAETNSYVLLRAIEWSLINGAKVLNLSFAGPADLAVHRILQAAHQRKVIAVAAAGNGGPSAAPVYPGAYREVIAVTAHDEADRLYAHANRGTYVALAAPGVDILAPSQRGSHEFLSGTSFAAAHVSGAIALLLERQPDLDPAVVRTLITNSAKSLGPKGPDNGFGAGGLQAYESLRALARR